MLFRIYAFYTFCSQRDYPSFSFLYHSSLILDQDFAILMKQFSDNVLFSGKVCKNF